MVHRANKCAWLLRNSKENCGKTCESTFCGRHNYLISKGKSPSPCRNCGIGVLCDCCLCISCGGSALKHKFIRIHKKAKQNFNLVLLELLSNQLENKHPSV